MNWWALIKLIASIIGQLPFSGDASVMSDAEMEILVRNEVESMLGDVSAQSWADIDFETLIAKLVALAKLVQDIIKIFQPKDPDASI